PPPPRTREPSAEWPPSRPPPAAAGPSPAFARWLGRSRSRPERRPRGAGSPNPPSAPYHGPSATSTVPPQAPQQDNKGIGGIAEKIPAPPAFRRNRAGPRWRAAARVRADRGGRPARPSPRRDLG